MIVLKFENIDIARAENERLKSEMNLPSEMEAFEIIEDEVVYTHKDAEIEKYIKNTEEWQIQQ